MGGQKSLGFQEFVEFENPTRAGCRRKGVSYITVKTGNQHLRSRGFPLCFSKNLGDWDASPITDTDHAEMRRAGIACTFHQMQTKWLGGGLRLGDEEFARRGDQAANRDRPLCGFRENLGRASA